MTASTSGTATDFEDLITQMVTFLTTDASLVSASQEWVTLRENRDGLAGWSTNLTELTGLGNRRVQHGCRYEGRSLNVDPDINTDNYVQTSGFAAGTSYIRFELRAATEIATVRLRAPNSPTPLNSMIKNFRLQWSDDDSAWTTALTVASATNFTLFEIKDYAVGGSPGAHVYWRILVDSNQVGAGAALYWQSILLLDGSGDIANHFGNELIFQAPGNAGTDEIYTGIRTEYDTTYGWNNIFLNGFTGYDSGNLDFFTQPGALPWYLEPTELQVPMVPCWDNAIDYWFAANGRSFRFLLKVSTVFEAGYLGFILPYATPSQYPYPLAVGGSMRPLENAPDTRWRYSDLNHYHSNFTTPAGDSSGLQQTPATLYLREPDGLWRSFANRVLSASPNAITTMTQSLGNPGGAFSMVWPRGVYSATLSQGQLPYQKSPTGGYVLQPNILAVRSPDKVVFGELDGVYAISGFDNAAENTVTVNSVNHIIFNNVFRTETHEYSAMALP